MSTERVLLYLLICALALTAPSCSDESADSGDSGSTENSSSPTNDGENGEKSGGGGGEEGAPSKDDVDKAMDALKGLKVPEGTKKAVADAASKLEGYGDVPGIPEIPKLTGDREKDKAALTAAIATLKQSWEKANAAVSALRLKKLTGESPELKKLEHQIDGYKKAGDVFEELLDKIDG